MSTIALRPADIAKNRCDTCKDDSICNLGVPPIANNRTINTYRSIRRRVTAFTGCRYHNKGI
jgi:hypothetical protein